MSYEQPHICRRDDDVAAWIRRRRDAHPENGSLGATIISRVRRAAMDYRLHADTGTPLTEDAVDGGDPEANGAYA